MTHGSSTVTASSTRSRARAASRTGFGPTVLGAEQPGCFGDARHAFRWVLDDEVFAGEVRSLRAPPRVRSWVPRAVASIRTGAIAGIAPALVAGGVYFALHHDADLPWVRIASILAVFGPAVGVLLATCVDGAVAAFDRIAATRIGSVRIVANPVTAGAVGGFVAGIVPGAVGVTTFGAFHGPFVGTPAIAGSLIAGAILIAAPLARRARERRRPRGPGDKRAILAGTIIATLTLCAAAAVVAPLIVDSAFAAAPFDDGAVIGAVAGALGGAIVGIYIGLAIALGRSLRA